MQFLVFGWFSVVLLLPQRRQIEPTHNPRSGMPAEHVEANHKQKREANRSLIFVLAGLGRRIRIGGTVL